jgi:signal peptidase I
LGSLVVLVAAAMLIFVRPIQVVGKSMEPNLMNTQHAYVIKHLPVHRFSVIAFDSKGVDSTSKHDTVYVKRVIGMPGDVIDYHKNGDLYINGMWFAQSFLMPGEAQLTTHPANSNMDFGNFNLNKLAKLNNWKRKGNRVPKGCYFVMGDNRDKSIDSRYFGYVPYSKVRGIVKLWPMQHDTSAVKYVNNCSY